MSRLGKAAMAVGAGAGVLAIRRRMSSGAGENRWLAVTVNRGPDEVTPGDRLPEPLRRLGDRVEIRIRPAAGTKGTETMARLRETPPTGVRRVAAR